MIEVRKVGLLSEADVQQKLESACAGLGISGRKLLVIIPDNTRTAPVGLFFKHLHRLCGGKAARLDYLVALGTHPQLGEKELLKRVGISREEKEGLYRGIGLFNHRWDQAGALTRIGSIGESEMLELTGGLLREPTEVSINRMLLDYDRVLVLGPVFPHEIAGFSGAGKYLFPGVSGPELTDVTHWLGGLQTNLATIGVRDTPVRRLIERAVALVPVPLLFLNLVVDAEGLKGLFIGSGRDAWEQAVALSAELNIRYVQRPYRQVLSIASEKYDDFWTGAKAFYKVEPIVADGGELIVYAPHIQRLSITHDQVLGQMGFHVKDYFLAHQERYGHLRKTVLGYAALVKGAGTYRDGQEHPRIALRLASAVTKQECNRLNIDYLDPREVRFQDWEGRQAEGRYVVRNAGEVLYRVRS
jgi:nickel-dependent lactate racemase